MTATAPAPAAHVYRTVDGTDLTRSIASLRAVARYGHPDRESYTLVAARASGDLVLATPCYLPEGQCVALALAILHSPLQGRESAVTVRTADLPDRVWDGHTDVAIAPATAGAGTWEGSVTLGGCLLAAAPPGVAGMPADYLDTLARAPRPAPEACDPALYVSMDLEILTILARVFSPWSVVTPADRKRRTPRSVHRPGLLLRSGERSAASRWGSWDPTEVSSPEAPPIVVLVMPRIADLPPLLASRLAPA